MPSILNLKFKGNKSFVAFSNLNDADALTKTWKVCTKVAGYLEQGQRLENLSWRLWHLQNLMVNSDDAKSKREFRKLSKVMGDKLDKEKGRSIEELEAPDFKRTPSTDLMMQRAAERERDREASQNAKPGTIKRFQFTFSLDQPNPAVNAPVNKPDLKPSPEFNKPPRCRTNAAQAPSVPSIEEESLTQHGRKPDPSQQTQQAHAFTDTNNSMDLGNEMDQKQALRFPNLFSSDFGPTALLYPAPSLAKSLNYGEGVRPNPGNVANDDPFNIPRPTFELPLDEILTNVDGPNGGQQNHTQHQWMSGQQQQQSTPTMASPVTSTNNDQQQIHSQHQQQQQQHLNYQQSSFFSFPQPEQFYQHQFSQPQPQHQQNQQQDVIMQSVSIADVSPASSFLNATAAGPAPMMTDDSISNNNNNNTNNNNSELSSSSSVAEDDSSVDDDSVSNVSGCTTNDNMAQLPYHHGYQQQQQNNARRHTQASPYHYNPPRQAALNAGKKRTRAHEHAPATVSPAKVFGSPRSSTPTGRPALTVRTGGSGGGTTPARGTLSASSSSVTSAGGATRGGVVPPSGSTAPGGVKAECSNCGATHTPLWRRGLNDELNCNACGLYCKLHKRPRPKTMRNNHRTNDTRESVNDVRNSGGDSGMVESGRSMAAPRSEPAEQMVVAQCYNCHTTATPLWRKDDEGKTVCNACGLYYKLHGTSRPISMKSDVIRKRSRHEARQAAQAAAAARAAASTSFSSGGYSSPDTPSASPVASRRASPEVQEMSPPTFAPDSSTATTGLNINYDYAHVPNIDDVEYRSVGGSSTTSDLLTGMSYSQFPGPYNPDYLTQQMYGTSATASSMLNEAALPFTSSDVTDTDLGGLDRRSSKRRRMSIDDEPPSSAVSSSYTGYDPGYASGASNASHGHSHSHSQRSSISMSDFPFSAFPHLALYGPNPNDAHGQQQDDGADALRGNAANPFWHPPLLPPSSFAQLGTGNNSNAGSANDAQGHIQHYSHHQQHHEHEHHGANGQSKVHPPMLPEIDYSIHPPMLPPQQQEEDLFSAFIHPPMPSSGETDHTGGSGGGGSNNYFHPPMTYDSWGYDTAMRY